MFSVRQKREIAEAIQKILRDTNHPELPLGEIQFIIRIDGAEPWWSWAVIRNNGAVLNPSVNPHNESQDREPKAPVCSYCGETLPHVKCKKEYINKKENVK